MQCIKGIKESYIPLDDDLLWWYSKDVFFSKKSKNLIDLHANQFAKDELQAKSMFIISYHNVPFHSKFIFKNLSLNLFESNIEINTPNNL